MTPTSVQDRVPFLRSIKTTLFLQAAVLVSVTVFLMVTTAFFIARAEVTRQVYRELQLLATSKEHFLQSTLASQREQVALLAQDETLASADNIQSLLGLSHLFLVDASGTLSILRGEQPPTDVLDAFHDAHLGGQTVFLPILSTRGFLRYAIASPMRHDGGVRGHLVAVFDARPLFSALLMPQASTAATRIAVALRHGGELVMVNGGQESDVHLPMYVGNYEERLLQGHLAAKAISGIEGMEQGTDYVGIPIFGAYRSIHSIGWGVIASVDSHLALAPVRRLSLTMFGGGLVIILFSVFIAWNMARRITSPLIALQQKLRQLETKHWHFPRSIYTGNEIEVVDAAAFDLAKRLRTSYAHLEEKVRERTRELSEAHAQDEAILASMEHGIVVTDVEGRIVLLNASAESLTGWTWEEATGKPYTDVLQLHDREDKTLASADHPLATVLTTYKKVIPVPDPGYSLLQRTGRKKPVSVVATPILRAGECIGVVAVLRDVSEDRRIDAMKSEFITIASHQLRTPLSSVRWNAEMLASDSSHLTEEQMAYAKEIDASTARMVRLVESLLEVVNLEIGTRDVRRDHIDLPSFIESAEQTFAFEISSKQMSIVHTFPKNLPKHFATDSVLLRLILENVIGNAIKYSPQGSHIEISLSHAKKDDAIILAVKDFGIGIPVHQHGQMFRKLFRADNAKASDTDGNGLGLYMSKLAADAIGAHLMFESDEGKGTTFRIKLPLDSGPSA